MESWSIENGVGEGFAQNCQEKRREIGRKVIWSKGFKGARKRIGPFDEGLERLEFGVRERTVE